jgi:hypothetical protein
MQLNSSYAQINKNKTVTVGGTIYLLPQIDFLYLGRQVTEAPPNSIETCIEDSVHHCYIFPSSSVLYALLVLAVGQLKD